MRYLHTMVRVRNLEQSLDFYCNQLGLLESHRHESEAGRFTLVYLYAPSDAEALVKYQRACWGWIECNAW